METYDITICLNQNEDVDLIDILEVIGERGKKASWNISGVECIGKSSDILHNYSDKKEQISGEELYQVCSDNLQVIDGEFKVFEQNESSFWILVRALDGTEFDIETDDLELLKNLRSELKGVKDLIY